MNVIYNIKSIIFIGALMETQCIRIGQKYYLHDALGGENDESSRESFILAQIKKDKVCLINLIDGNRWNKAVKVKSVFNISEEEFLKIVGDDPFSEFHLISQEQQ